MTRRLAWLIGAVMLLLPAGVWAQNSCGLPKQAIADGRIQTGSVAAGATEYFMVATVPGRSYSFQVASVLPNAWTQGNLNITGYSDAGGCSAAIPGLVHTNGTDAMIVALSAANAVGDRVNWLAATTSFAPFNLYEFSVTNSTGAPISFEFTASDTTLFSTAWSTFGSYDSFYSLYNTTNTTCNGTLTLFNTAGTAVTTAAVAINSGATTATNTAALGTVRNAAGTARFTHNCPPGAILAEAAIANFSITPTPYFQFVHFQTTRESIH